MLSPLQSIFCIPLVLSFFLVVGSLVQLIFLQCLSEVLNELFFRFGFNNMLAVPVNMNLPKPRKNKTEILLKKSSFQYKKC